jgi:DNA-binding IclR family transcriptional regulator
MAGPAAKGERRATSLNGSDNSFTVRALAKGLSILALFDAENRELTLDEIAERAGLPRMTAYRMIRTMESAWYLVRDAVTNRYHLGPAMLASTYLSEGYEELSAIVRPYLCDLTEDTGEAATLAIEVDGVAVSVDMVDTPRPLKREVAVGRMIGDTASANGKIFAAFKPAAERAEMLARPHPQLTPHTITDPEALAREMDRVVDEGVAFDIEERNIGTCAVAAPVRDQLGAVVAAVSVIVPAGRFGPDEQRSYAEAVKASAEALSSFLGYSRRR